MELPAVRRGPAPIWSLWEEGFGDTGLVAGGDMEATESANSLREAPWGDCGEDA